LNLFELFVKIGVQDEATDKLGKITQSLGNGLKAAAQVGVAAVGVAASGIAALTTSAVKNYAEYEQLVGGVDTLFKDSSGKVQEYAQNAYKTAGLSANEYMSTVTSFSASLIQSLGGDTEKAVEYANTAITDMSDNANKMGTDIGMIQNAYNGFAKGNFTMLDNLKLGYGGTQEEMKRLLADAQKISGIKYDISSYADVVQAIHVIQDEMGIAGATAAEAASTIEGSLASAKSAWQNLVTGIADENADFDTLVMNFVDSVATAADNILPRVEIALTGAASLIDKLFPVIMERIPSIIENTLPRLAESAFHIVETIVNGVLENAPALFELAVDILIMLAQGIAGNVEQLTTSLVEVILKIVEVLTNPDSLTALFGAALDIIIGLATGIIKAIPQLLKSIPKIIEGIVVTIGNLLYKITEVGKNIVNGIWQGIQAKKAEFERKIRNFFEGIVTGVKSALGIHSPSRVFAAIGKFMADGLGEGWEDEFSGIKKAIDNSLVFDDPKIGISASVNGAKGGQIASGGNVFNFTFNGVQSNDPQEFMEYIARELQKFFERRELIYG
jgi:phage-related protein